MKKFMSVLIVLLACIITPKITVNGAVGCQVSPQFCIVDDGGGTGGFPDNYLVDTGLVAAIVKADGYLVGYYNIYVRANEIVVDLYTSDLFFRNNQTSGNFLTDYYINQRNPRSGGVSGGSYMLNSGVTQYTFETYSIYTGVVVVDGYTILTEVGRGTVFFNYGQSNQSTRLMNYAYYNYASDTFLIAEDDGMDGSFGKIIFAKPVSPTGYSDSHVLGRYYGASAMSAYTNYYSYASLSVNTDIANLFDIIVINR